ncbi:hypothetical protein Tco_0161585 [Tanacetum coccineum]
MVRLVSTRTKGETRVVAGYRCASSRDCLVPLLSSSEQGVAMSVSMSVEYLWIYDSKELLCWCVSNKAYLATITNSKLEPFKDFRETEIPQLLPIASPPVRSSDDPYLIIGQAHTPAAIDTESEAEESPSET